MKNYHFKNEYIMNTEEKAKAYDEALEKARQLCAYPTSKPFISDLQDLFPELKESDDERIRKALIHLVNSNKELSFGIDNYDGIKWIDILAWLEKQGEHANFCSKIQIGDKVTRNEDGVLVNLSQLKRVAKKDEKQGEQKPTSKVEPKFKVGDWIVFNGLTLYIKEVVKGYYRTISKGGITNSYDLDIDNVARLWTIQDAKDGDVLAFDNDNIVIFKDLYNSFTFHSYCYIEDGLFDVSKDDMSDWWEGKGFQPATKEERDTLEKAMADAGYTFDFEKKELKKIENEIEIPFGAKDSELQKATYYIPKGFHAEIEGNNVVIKKGEQKLAWSKEDEVIVNSIISFCDFKVNIELHNEEVKIASKNILSWLNKLKYRVQPKQEWSEEDEKCIRLSTDIIDSSLRAGLCVQLDRDRCVDWFKSLKDLITGSRVTSI